ncbi:MAG: hypothetical protein K2X47_14330 [Bdellovibrionales bacterium]|nr:hypothetical protein [Bdellovibrionales bacterium]
MRATTLFLLATSLCLFGCSSTSEEEELNPNVHPAAYQADGFQMGWNPPSRPAKDPRRPFFNKSCSAREGAGFSKIDYYCDY